MKYLAVCGKLCEECNQFNENCKGCPGTITCNIYECCIKNKNLSNCGRCNMLPCKIFEDIHVPVSNEQEQTNSVQLRIIRLIRHVSRHED